jgi:hypothetical protein
MEDSKKNQATSGNDGMKDEGGSKKKSGGIEFMSRRMNVANTVFELAVTKKITPAERNLIDIIEMGTIGAKNDSRQFSTKAQFIIDDLSSALRYKEKDKIWKLLKSLDKKGVITREKTRFKNAEIIGLNPRMMGQILIDKLHDDETKRMGLRVVVDNSKDKPTIHPGTTDESSVNHVRSVGSQRTDRPESITQTHEIIDENSLLDSYRLNLDSSRKGFETFSFWKSRGSAAIQLDNPEDEKLRQIEMARKAGILE